MNEFHKSCGGDEWRIHIREDILPWALGDRDLGDDVLEVGPGYGASTDVLCERAARITAVEIDPALVEVLRERFAGSLTVEIVEGDAARLDFPDQRFSGAASFTVMHHVPTAELQDRIFAEVARVLRPGGVFALGDSLWTRELEDRHVGDTYNPVDPATVVPRLRNAGFARADVRTGDNGWWASVAVTPRAPVPS